MDFEGLGEDYLDDIDAAMSPVCDQVVDYVSSDGAESMVGENFTVADHVRTEWSECLERPHDEPVQTVIDLLQMANDRGEISNEQIAALSFGDLQVLADNYVGPLLQEAHPKSGSWR